MNGYYSTTDEAVRDIQSRSFAAYRTKLADGLVNCYKDLIKMSKLFDDHDEDMLLYAEEKRGANSAISEMLDLLILKENWWDGLVQSLETLSLTELLSGLHQAFEKEKMDMEEEEMSVGTDNISDSKLKTGHLGIGYPRVDAVPLIPRKYQKELAQKPMMGHNCLICAPTNSGKTFVSIMIAKEHLLKFKKSSADGAAATDGAAKACVLFLVPRFALLQQVCRQFHEQLPAFRVAKKGGGVSINIKLDRLIKYNDVVVVTHAILKNAMEDGSVKFSDFTLLIFDECHHANKDHDYNKIMARYITEKENAKPDSLPQVIGLTASPGAGRSVNALAAREWILKLCANLDTRHFVMVREHEDELKLFANVPQRMPLEVGQRAPNPFVESICRYMRAIETLARFARFADDSERGTQMYEGCVVSVKQQSVAMKEVETVICCEHLIKVNEALELSALVRMQDGYALLEECFEKDFVSRGNGLLDIEKNIMSKFTELLENIKTSLMLEDKFPNPKLTEVKRIIMSTKRDCDMDDSKEFRAMVYTKTRQATLAVYKWLKDDPELTLLNADYLTGIHASADVGGMTSEKTKSTLEEFDKGCVKILVCTTVGEEGINIPACRLVIRYNHVTNEISMIQARGRIREKIGNEVVIGDMRVLAKDQTNILLEEVMHLAMQEILKYDADKFNCYIKFYQRQTIAGIKSKEIQKEAANMLSSPNNTDVAIYCRKCDTIACPLFDMRRINTSNYINAMPEFTSKFKLKDRDFTSVSNQELLKIYCMNCEYEWGNMAVGFPCLKITSFTVDNGTERRQVKQWKKVKYVVPALFDDY